MSFVSAYLHVEGVKEFLTPFIGKDYFSVYGLNKITTIENQSSTNKALGGEGNTYEKANNITLKCGR
jgi:hypothetical protein